MANAEAAFHMRAGGSVGTTTALLSMGASRLPLRDLLLGQVSEPFKGTVFYADHTCYCYDAT